ncbi:MAG: SDR family oxidoreductase [Leptospiraceae bacterium]
MKERILILGASGMLGSSLVRYFHQNEYPCFGTIRSESWKRYFSNSMHDSLIDGINVLTEDDLLRAFKKSRPDLVINCIGIIKQQSAAHEPMQAIPINAWLPHRLSAICDLLGSRLIQISTDCVFRGDRGGYSEQDHPDATDLYGKTKELGEVSESSNAITLRTSIIGHELASNYSLVDWFLSQSNTVQGYTRAMYSGFPTIELAEIIRNHIIPRSELNGLYHVSSEPISKFELLKLIAARYKHEIDIVPESSTEINRVLLSDQFRTIAEYTPPSWTDLVDKMYRFRYDGKPNVQ